jgi:hypothetical protein
MTLAISAEGLPSWVSVELALSTIRTASSATSAASWADREISAASFPYVSCQ